MMMMLTEVEVRDYNVPFRYVKLASSCNFETLEIKRNKEETPLTSGTKELVFALVIRSYRFSLCVMNISTFTDRIPDIV